MQRARWPEGRRSRSGRGDCAVRAREYAGIGFLQVKLALVVIGAFGALALHAAHGFLLEQASGRRLAGHALLSLLCWPSALVCGRLIAFAGD
jgi:hypothetical protein